MNESQVYDIFLTHGAQDGGLAKFVVEELTDAGLAVFATADIGPGQEISMTIRDEMAGAQAVVILITRSTLENFWVAYEVGLASGLRKPILAVYDGIGAGELPGSVANLPCYPVSELSKVIEAVKRSRTTLSGEEREQLIELYGEQDTPTDRLVLAPHALELLTHRFNAITGKHVSGEQVVRELIRLRKQGQLPRLSKQTEV